MYICLIVYMTTFLNNDNNKYCYLNRLGVGEGVNV